MVSYLAIYIIAIAIGSIVVANVVNTILKASFRRFEESARNIALLRKEPFEERKTRFVVVRRLLVFAVYFLAAAWIIVLLPGARTVAYSMLAGAGVAAIILGFAFQKTFANFISGVVIAFTQPFRIGDRVQFRGDFAVVEDISLSFTTLRVWTNKRIIVPNSIMTDEIVENFTIGDPKMSRALELGVAYETDIQLARKIILEELQAHPDVLDARTKEELKEGAPQHEVFMTALGDNAITLRTTFTCKDNPTAWKTEHLLREAIKQRFDKVGITIPFPQRTVWMQQAQHSGKKQSRTSTPKAEKKTTRKSNPSRKRRK